MRLASAVLACIVLAAPFVAVAQPRDPGLVADEQILLKRVMTDRRAVYAATLELSEAEERAFWPIYDEYEAKVAKLDNRFVALVNEFAARYETLSDADAAPMLREKMAIEAERMALKQTYTRKVARVLPARKALRYAQVETRIENLLRREVYGLIPLAQ